MKELFLSILETSTPGQIIKESSNEMNAESVMLENDKECDLKATCSAGNFHKNTRTTKLRSLETKISYFGTIWMLSINKHGSVYQLKKISTQTGTLIA